MLELTTQQQVAIFTIFPILFTWHDLNLDCTTSNLPCKNFAMLSTPPHQGFCSIFHIVKPDLNVNYLAYTSGILNTSIVTYLLPYEYKLTKRHRNKIPTTFNICCV